MASSGIYEEDYDSDSDSILAVESDVDSNFEDSPVDGYFSERQHPQETFVENSSVLAEANAKAREAAEHRASSSRAVPPIPSAAVPSWSAVEPPTTHHEAPPPDYEAATASPVTTETSFSSTVTQSAIDTSYESSRARLSEHMGSSRDTPWHSGNRGSTFSQGLPFLQTGGVPGHHTTYTFQGSGGPDTRHGQIQSMSDLQPDERTGLLKRSRQRKSRWTCGCTTMSIFNAILITAIVILIIVLSSGSGESDGSVSQPKRPSESTPGKGNLTPTIPPSIPTPPMPIPSVPVPSIPATARCPYEYYSDTVAVDFVAPQNFTLTEFIESDHFSGGISGSLRVRAGPEDQESAIRVFLTVATTRPWKTKEISFNKEGDTLNINDILMQKTRSGYSGRPCIWIYVRIEIRPGTQLEAFDLATGHLDVYIEDNLFDSAKDEEQTLFAVTHSSNLHAVRGSMDIAYWSSRETVVEVIAGSIQGTFALRDLLSLKTQAGSIQVSVDPKKADTNRPRPAEFIASSKAGSINVGFPTGGHIPERVYKTRVDGYSSSIQGSYILGSATSLHSNSGQIDAVLLPYFDRRLSSTFITDTEAGSTTLRILSPYDRAGDRWAESPSTHKTTSVTGSIDVTYPQEWEGVLDCSAVSGSIDVSGKDVRITRDERLGPMRHVTGAKGSGQGQLSLKSTSGSIQLKVGNER